MLDKTKEDWIKEWIEEYKEDMEKIYYVDENGYLFNKDNDEPLCDFLYRPKEIIKKINESGVWKIDRYVLEGVYKGREWLDEFVISAADIRSYKWINKWGYCKILRNNEKQTYTMLLNNMENLEKEAPIVLEYDSIGWQKYGEQWFYLSSSEAIGDLENINVRTSLDNFTFKKDASLSPREAFVESMKMLDIGSYKLTYTLLSYLLTSIVTTPLINSKALAPNYLLWIVGGTGYGKSTFTSFFTNIFNENNLARPDDHKTTVIEPALRKHKDCTFIIDDFGTAKTSRTYNSVIEKIETIIRKFTDRQISLEGEFNGMVIITGESFLQNNEKNESSIKRTIRVKMDNLFNREEETFSEERLAKFNSYIDKLILPTSIFYYIKWICGKLNSSFIEMYRKDFDKLRLEIGGHSNVNGRYVDSFVHQILAFNFYLSYARENEYITPEEYLKTCIHVKEVFIDLLNDQFETVYDKGTELFFRTLKKLIVEEKIIIQYNQKSLDVQKNVFGVVNIKDGKQVLLLHYQVILNMIENELDLAHKRILPSDRMLGKYLKQYNLLYGQSTTTPFTSFDIPQMNKTRVLGLKPEMLPYGIMEVIAEKRKDPKPHNSVLLGGWKKESKKKKK